MIYLGWRFQKIVMKNWGEQSTLVRSEVRHFGAGPASCARLASNSVFIQGIAAETLHARQAAQHGQAWQ
jgi:hypothetical protein